MDFEHVFTHQMVNGGGGRWKKKMVGDLVSQRRGVGQDLVRSHRCMMIVLDRDGERSFCGLRRLAHIETYEARLLRLEWDEHSAKGSVASAQQC